MGAFGAGLAGMSPQAATQLQKIAPQAAGLAAGRDAIFRVRLTKSRRNPGLFRALGELRELGDFRGLRELREIGELRELRGLGAIRGLGGLGGAREPREA